MNEHQGIWLMPIVFGGLAALRLVALGSRVRGKDGRLAFTVSLPYRLIMLLGEVGVGGVLLLNWSNSEIWERLTLSAISLGLALGWPSKLVLDEQGIERILWWRPLIQIPWKDVVSIEENGAGEYRIYGRDKPAIDFSKFHVDPQRFISEVLARTHLKVSRSSDPTSIAPH
jgi:hypothetical protein